jgi:hypothetical protein
MKKIFIPNEKVARCKTCKHFTRFGTCTLHIHCIDLPRVSGDDFCGSHSDLKGFPEVDISPRVGLLPEEKAFIKRQLDRLFAGGYRGRGLV